MFENFLFSYNMTFIRFTKVGRNRSIKKGVLKYINTKYHLYCLKH